MDYTQRAAEYGVIGKYLLRLVNGIDSLDSLIDNSSFVAQLVSLRNATSGLRATSPLLPAAISLICLPFPLQTELSIGEVHLLLKDALKIPGTHIAPFSPWLWEPSTAAQFTVSRSAPRASRQLVRLAITSPGFRAAAYPVKNHPGAPNKINVVLGDLVRSCVTVHGAGVVGRLLGVTAGRVSEDQVCAALIYASGLTVHFGVFSWSIAAHLITNPDDAKALSNTLKSLGVNATPYGCVLTETQTMLGRGVGSIDVDEKAAERCDPSFIASRTIKPDYDSLRVSVRAVIDRELRGRDVKVPSLHDFWTSRWAWCVNGSETAQSDLILGVDRARTKKTHARSYRRMAAESIEHEPVTGWDGKTYVSCSPKLEHGKTRAIFACDTRSYFAFSWLLNSVQPAWRNERILLDPGKGGHIGISDRIRGAQFGGGVNLMLDYDDFNSQHTTRSMQIVFEELCDRVGMPRWYRDVLVASFDDTWVRVRGGWQRVLGTLMSGHRGTTIINSILNAAYIRDAIGGARYDALMSIHTGDDVFIRAHTLGDCEFILRRTREYGCLMNPTKQSVGYFSAEFLRMAQRGGKVHGYFARGVASMVSGNWNNLDPLLPLNGLTSAITTTRSLINRSGCNSLPRVIGPALRYRLSLSVRQIISLLAGQISLEGSPVFNTNYVVRNLRPEVPRPEDLAPDPGWARYATKDYLTDHLSPVEVEALRLCPTDPTPSLVASSYSKGLNQDGRDRRPPVTFRRLPPRPAHGFASAVQLMRTPAHVGCLASSPIVRLIENRLTDDDLRTLVRMAGGDTGARDIRREAFGDTSDTKNIIGFLSYADAASLSKRTASGNIFTSFHICV